MGRLVVVVLLPLLLLSNGDDNGMLYPLYNMDSEQLMGMQLHTPIQDQAPLHNEICRPRQDYLLGKNQVTVKLTTMTIQTPRRAAIPLL